MISSRFIVRIRRYFAVRCTRGRIIVAWVVISRCKRSYLPCRIEGASNSGCISDVVRLELWAVVGILAEKELA